MTNICIKCGEEKDIELFRNGKNVCKKCMSIQLQEWRQKNAEYLREYQQKNADKIRERNREWRQKNADYIREYRQKNADKLHEYRQKNADYFREYYQKNANYIHCQKKEYYKENADTISKKASKYYQEKACLIGSCVFFNQNGLSIKNVPKELFELKALQLELKRETKKQRENEK